jgi:UDP-3-O-[3-hydroxymyristoyl] glucosamine N-acyltransferase
VEDSTLRNAVVGEQTTIRHSELHDSMIGDAVVLDGVTGTVMVGDHCEVRRG